MSRQQINTIIANLDYKELTALKTIAKAVLKVIETHLNMIENQDAAMCRARRDYRRYADTAAIVAEHLEKKGRLDLAIKITAEETGIPEITILEHWKIAEKLRRDLTRAIRDREIIKMISSGKSNQEIATALNLHPDSVSRIISRHIGKRKKMIRKK